MKNRCLPWPTQEMTAGTGAAVASLALLADGEGTIGRLWLTHALVHVLDFVALKVYAAHSTTLRCEIVRVTGPLCSLRQRSTGATRVWHPLGTEVHRMRLRTR